MNLTDKNIITREYLKVLAPALFAFLLVPAMVFTCCGKPDTDDLR